jgi:hypothetical protein
VASYDQIVDFTKEELANAVQGPTDDFLVQISPGLFLLPFPLVLGSLATIAINAIGDLTQNFQRVPILVASRVLVEAASLDETTRVCTLRDAKKHAADLVLAAVYELAGRNPPASFGLYQKSQHVRGLRKRLIKLEERQILGSLGSRLLGILRAPVTFFVQLVKLLWNLAVAIASLGAVFALWSVVSGNWSKVALSQSHKRKRMRAYINRRV